MPLATSFLVPATSFLIILALFVVAVTVPLIDTIVRRRWVWAFAVVLTGPLAGAAWLLFGRWRRDTLSV